MADIQDDIKKVRELIDLMKENDLVELELSNGEKKIHIKRPQPMLTQVPMTAAAPLPTSMGIPGEPVQAAPGAAGQAAAAKEAALVEIQSPIVGTFYAAANPESPPYVQTGDKVTPDTVVCIVEAMKVMNEIKAETTGTIVKVLVQDGQSVEYGQVLFMVRP